MKNFKTEQAFLDFIGLELNFEPSISVILERPYMEYILDDKVDFETVTFSKEIDSDCYTYLIDKTEEEGDIHLHIMPIKFDDDGELETKIVNDYVIVQEGLLDGEDIENIYAEEELIIVGYEDEENIKDLDDEAEQFAEDMCELVKDYTELIQNTNGCPGCIEEVLHNLVKEVLDIFTDSEENECDYN